MKYNDKNKPLVCMMTQSTCYKGTRKFTPKGVLWHSTGANNPWLKRYVQPDDNAADRAEWLNRLGKNQYSNDWNHIDRQAGLNFWIGKLADGTVTAVQTMPWNYRPWGCGSGSKGSCNDTHIQFEICEDGLDDKSYWEAVYKEACEMTAYLCKMFSIDPKGTVSYNGLFVPTIIDHTGSNSLGLGSNHGDIQHWSRKYGKTMENVRNDVAAILAGNTDSVSVETPAVSTDANLKKGSKGDEVKTMQTMLIACGYSCGSAGADGDFGNNTLAAVKAFQKDKGLTVDGIYGPVTKAALEKAYAERGTTTGETVNQLRARIVNRAISYLGCNEADGSHKKIIDLYNSQNPLPVGYKVTYSDAWCDAFASAVAVAENLTDIIPTECGCERHIALFKKIGRWVEDDAYVPAPGDYIFYDWDDSGSGDNTGGADHVGIVVSVSGSTIKVIEGNKSDAVGYRNISANGRYIRGYGVPDYEGKASASSPPASTPSDNPSSTTTDEAKLIWDRLYAAIKNPYGVAGVLANFMAESSMKSTNLQDTFEKKLIMTDEEYTAAVDNGAYTNFVHDGGGYGLFQATFWSIKESLLNYAKSRGASIGDRDMQVDWFIQAMKEQYTSIWNVLTTAKSVREASDAVLLKFERPADQSEAVQVKRASYGEQFYAKYASTSVATQETPTDPSSDVEKPYYYRVRKNWSDKNSQIGSFVILQNAINCAQIAGEAYAVFGEDGKQVWPEVKESLFTHYALTDTQLVQIARLCQQEQGTVAGAKAEASLMANQLETSKTRQQKYGTGADGLYNWVRNGGWFSRAAHWMDNGSVSDAVLAGVKDVLVNGNRTLPLYVDEHDCLSDIKSISTGNVKDRSAYIQGKTVVKNTYGSTWTFWCFPDSSSDPFGYTDAAYKAVNGAVENETSFTPYRVRVSITDLRIRTGPGTDYDWTGKYTGKGVFTAVAESTGKGSDKGWIKLKSGAGWISLDYAERI